MSREPEVIDLSESISDGPDIPQHNADDQKTQKDVKVEETIVETTPSDQKRPLNFIDLPPEIRNMIYRLLVVCPHLSFPKPAPEDFAIFCVNRLIFTEASAIYYADNVFRFSLTPAFVGALRPAKRLNPNLHRISKCQIWRDKVDANNDPVDYRVQINWLDEYARMMIKIFVEALKGKGQLQFLLVDLPDIDATILEPLAALRNIKQVQIKRCWGYARFGQRSMEIVKRLEVVMKSGVQRENGRVIDCIDLERVEMRNEVEEFEKMKVDCEWWGRLNAL